MALFSEDEIARAFDSGAFARGRAYQRDGHVRQLTVSADGATISGSVHGNQREPYSQVIGLKRRNTGALDVTGTCSCPVGHNCKHVAAVLLEHLARAENAPAGVMFLPLNQHSPSPYASSPLQAPSPTSALSGAVAHWLDQLAAASGAAATPKKTAKDSKSLVYVLNHRDGYVHAGRNHARLRAVVIRTRKDGSIVENKSYDPALVTRPPSQIARFLTSDDIDLLRDMVWLKRADERSTYSVDIALTPDALGTRVLAKALASGRARFGSITGPILTEGPAVRAEARWTTTDNGAQRLVLVPMVECIAEASGLSPAPIREGDPPELAPSLPSRTGGLAGVSPAGSGAGPAHEAIPPFDLVLPLAPPHYVDTKRGLVGVIDTDLPEALAAAIVAAPVVAPSEAAIVRELMAQRLGGDTKAESRSTNSGENNSASNAKNRSVALLPLPDAPESVETRNIAPIPRLEMFIADARMKPSYSWYDSNPRHRGAFKVPVARLAFEYGGHVVPHADTAQFLQVTEDDKLVLIVRDAKVEDRAADLLRRMDFGPVNKAPFSVASAHAHDLFLYLPGNRQNGYELIATFDEPARFLEFSRTAVPVLRAEGWQVAFSDDYPYQFAEGEVSWWADVDEGSGIDWMSFEVGIEFDGHRINLIPALAGLIGELPADLARAVRGKVSEEAWLKLCRDLTLYHALPDGRLLALPGERVAPILKALIELVGPRGERLDGSRVKLHRAEAASLADFAGVAGDSVAWAASAERLIELGDKLKRGSTRAKIKPPKAFKAHLRPYQVNGLGWLDFLREAGFGGVLADDMGLGKTVQALAFLAHEKAQGRLDRPALIVAPTSVLLNWKAEAARFTPNLKLLPLHGPDRAQSFGAIGKQDLVITTYPLLARDAGTLLTQEFHAAILDEAQAIKNPKAAIAGIAHQINARHRFALTGTPLENNLGEVWSLFQFLAPGLLGDEGAFRRTFRTPIEKHGDKDAQAFLSRRLKPFMLRRTKEEVAPELPKKTEIIETISLEGAQRDLYETVRMAMHEKVRAAIDKQGLARSHIVFLDALLKMRQVCCDPRLLKLPAARKVRASAKLDRLMEMIPEMIAEGRRILLFSQFTSMLELIEEELRGTGIQWVKLTGQTADRETPIKAFQTGKVPLFLLSLKAGGTGLNLTAADTVVHYDPWWNPAVENQATDRAHRIGQQKPVFVYKLIVEEGIEQAIELLKSRKAALADALFAGSTDRPLDLTEADITALFAPLSPRRTEKQAA